MPWCGFMCFGLEIHWAWLCFNAWKLLPLSTWLKFFLPRPPMSFYSYVHYIVYHFSYIFSSKQCWKNVELFPLRYFLRKNSPDFFSLFLWLTLLKILYGWFFSPFLPLHIDTFFFFFNLATLPFSLWLFFLILIVFSCFNCDLDTDSHFKHLY